MLEYSSCLLADLLKMGKLFEEIMDKHPDLLEDGFEWVLILILVVSLVNLVALAELSNEIQVVDGLIVNLLV